MDGLLLIDKPGGISSHDIVQAVRRAAGQRKVGHAGTLDPLATGLILVALGRATRTLEYLLARDKRYEAELHLGQRTDSYDADGEIVSTHDGPLPDQATIDVQLTAFRGEILQKPPIYSALKRRGEALYKKARRGETVELEARPVTIYELTLSDWSPPYLTLHVHCAKGTYIRSLAHDLGEALGVGAHLSGLRRTAIGDFSLAQATPLAAIRAADPATLRGWLLPLGAGLSHLPSFPVDEAAHLALSRGQSLDGPLLSQAGPVRALDAAGNLVAIVRWRADRGWQPQKVFLSAPNG